MSSQTIESKGKRLVPTLGFFLDRLWISLYGIAFTAVISILLWLLTPFWQNVQAIWTAPVTLVQVQAQVAALKVQVSDDVAALRTDLTAVTGDNRVIRQTPGLSYVTEPVHVGEPVILNLVAARTELGARCVLTSGQSLFTEEGGVITPGSEVKPSRQIGEDQTRMRVRLVPPDTLRPGRIELYLALEYDCDGRRQFERTDVVTYRLLPVP